MLVSDILDNIFSLVELPTELLALALSCKEFHSLVIPYHLHLRHIRCDPLLVSLWNELEDRPAYARRVTRLELVSGYSYGKPPQRIPSFLVSEEHLNEVYPLGNVPLHAGPSVLMALTAALRNMYNLQRFCWVDIRIEESASFFELFSQIRKSCPFLKEFQLEIDDKEPVVDFNLSGASLWQFSNLTSLSLAIIPPSLPILFDSMISMILHQCPSLQDLNLTFPIHAFNVGPLLQQGHWPKLRRLTLIGNMNLAADDSFTSEGNVTTAEFMMRHPMLECLSFHSWTNDGPTCTIYPGTLPSLRSLSIPHRNHTPVSVPFDIARHIHYFCLFVCHDVKRDMILDTLASMSTLRCLVITGWPRDRLASLVRVIPQVERLKFARPLVSSWSGFQDYEKSELEPLHSLTRLTHLAGLAWVKTVADLSESLLKILAANRALKYVAITPMAYTERKDLWICLERNYEGEIMGWSDAQDTYDLNWKNWGDIFHGLVPLLF